MYFIVLTTVAVYMTNIGYLHVIFKLDSWKRRDGGRKVRERVCVCVGGGGLEIMPIALLWEYNLAFMLNRTGLVPTWC